MITIVSVSIIRKRPDSNEPCNPDLHDDDKEIRSQIMHIVGCVPPYWKHLQINPQDFADCTSSTQLKEIYNQIKNYRTIMEHYNPPCDDMNIVTTVQELQKVRATGMEIYYLHRYEETINRRDFGFEMFWASIGGFIGMFLGFSLLQIPDLIMKLMKVKI